MWILLDAPELFALVRAQLPTWLEQLETARVPSQNYPGRGPLAQSSRPISAGTGTTRYSLGSRDRSKWGLPARRVTTAIGELAPEQATSP